MDSELDFLLSQAKENLASSVSNDNSDNITAIRKSWTKLPKLDSGFAISKLSTKAQGPIKLQDESNNRKSGTRINLRTINDPISVKRQLKEAKESSAGEKWFNMPKPEMTSSTKRDLQLLQMRNVLDPKRHYKKDKGPLPVYFQTGTIVEGNTEFYSARLSRKERKKTVAEEILADASSKAYFKRKYAEIQKGKRSGRKEHYKKLKEMRK